MAQQAKRRPGSRSNNEHPPRFAVCLADPPDRQGRPRSEGLRLGLRLPRAAVAALLCPGLFSPCPSGAADGASLRRL